MQTLKEKDTPSVLKEVTEIYSAKGKKLLHLNLKKDKPSQSEIMALLLGPTGNLRAPSVRRGKTLVVGFHEETYEKVFV
jgi:arsenate reductase-like glutaredoxin family protein